MRILVIHGANLNLLGSREPEIYGKQTLRDANERIATVAAELELAVVCEQYNGEGAIIDALHSARDRYDGVIINPGAYCHYSYAIADAIRSIGIPVVETHVTNIAAREEFRRQSVTAAACRGIVGGFGVASYDVALYAMAKILEK